MKKRINNFQYIYFLQLITRGVQNNSFIEITRVDDSQYCAPYPFYLILLKLVELV